MINIEHHIVVSDREEKVPRLNQIYLNLEVILIDLLFLLNRAI